MDHCGPHASATARRSENGAEDLCEVDLRHTKVHTAVGRGELEMHLGRHLTTLFHTFAASLRLLGLRWGCRPLYHVERLTILCDVLSNQIVILHCVTPEDKPLPLWWRIKALLDELFEVCPAQVAWKLEFGGGPVDALDVHFIHWWIRVVRLGRGHAVCVLRFGMGCRAVAATRRLG